METKRDKITANFILSTIKGWVEEQKSISPQQWLDIALKLSMLEADEHDDLITKEQALANAKFNILLMQEKRNVAQAEIEVQVKPEYKEYRLQKLKVDRIDETIRLAKKNADLQNY